MIPPPDYRRPSAVAGRTTDAGAGQRPLQAALNGDRKHPAAPRTPEELAAEARAAVNAGGTSSSSETSLGRGAKLRSLKPIMAVPPARRGREAPC